MFRPLRCSGVLQSFTLEFSVMRSCYAIYVSYPRAARTSSARPRVEQLEYCMYVIDVPRGVGTLRLTLGDKPPNLGTADETLPRTHVKRPPWRQGARLFGLGGSMGDIGG